MNWGDCMRPEFKRIESSNSNQQKVSIVEKEGVTLLEIPIFKRMDWLVQGFSTRLGGVSEGVCASMNLSFSRGDKEEAVRENYRRICNSLQIKEEQLVFSHQTHTTNIRKVTKADCGKGIVKPLDYENIDGLITNEAGVVLTTFYADCVPIYLVDEVHHAIGLVHSGWRGTVGKISQCALQKMEDEYGTRAEEVYAAIGPSICQVCYEVSEDVKMEFDNSFSKEIADTFFEAKENGHFQLDLWRANQYILTQAGVRKERIQVTDICTCCNPKLLFSHRASAGKRGNLAAFLGIK